MNEKKKFKMPSAFTVLISLIFIIGIITQFIPGIQSATLADMVGAPVAGFASAMDVSLFVLILGGFLGIVTETGALNAGIGIVVKKLNGKEIWIIPILMFIISIGGTTYGMAEETIALYSLVVATMVAAGFDSITAASTILLGSTAGVLGSTVNPFVVSVSVDAMATAGIEVNQSIIMIANGISWLVCYALCAVYVMRYGKKVKANKAATLLTADEQKAVAAKYSNTSTEDIVFTGKQKLVMILFALSFVVMIISVVPWSSFGVTIFEGTSFLTGNDLGTWWFSDLSTWFLLCSIITGIVYGLKEPVIVRSFINGAADLISVALVVSVSRGISVVMSTTGFDLYILNAASEALAGTNALVFTALAYIVFLVLGILIPSSSGLATVSMPIFGPLAASLGLPPEIMVCVLSGASATMNAISPTSGVLMGGTSIACIEFSTWVKYIWKIVATLIVVHIVILSVAMMVF